MSKVVFHVSINTRVYLWLKYLADQEKANSVRTYVEQVLLGHLTTTPGVDLSQSPYSKPKEGKR